MKYIRELGKTIKISSKSDTLEFILILPRKAKLILLLTTFGLIFLSFLELLAVVLSGALVIFFQQNAILSEPNPRFSKYLDWLNIDSYSLSRQIIILSTIVAVLFIGKTLVSFALVKRIFLYMSIKSAELTTEIIAKYMNQNLTLVQKISPVQFLDLSTNGVKAIYIGIISNSINLISDLSTLIIIVGGLFVIYPEVSIATVLLFSFVILILRHLLGNRSKLLGEKFRLTSIERDSQILELLRAYKELYVSNRTGYYIDRIRKLGISGSKLQSEFEFKPFIGKYVIELTTILSVLILALVLTIISNPLNAMPILTMFIVASSRIAPTLLRINQTIINLRFSIGLTKPTFDLLNELNYVVPLLEYKQIKHESSIDFHAEVEISDVSFSYSNSSRVLSDINLKVDQGSSCAIIGASGAGKTTLINLILGLIEPNIGQITIAGDKPINIINKFPGALAYVPQDIFISNSTIKQNVCLGYLLDSINETDVWEALELAELKSFVSGLPDQLNTELGENGYRLSGGQKQRLAIARALFSKPKVLILDEATSALDIITEDVLTNTLRSLSSKVTLIIIAHRLSTIKLSDKIAFLENGKILATGNFKEISEKVPNFQDQIDLMSIN